MTETRAVPGIIVNQQEVKQTAFTNPLVTAIGDYARGLGRELAANRNGPGADVLGLNGSAFAVITSNLDRTFRQGLNNLIDFSSSTAAWSKFGAVPR